MSPTVLVIGAGLSGLSAAYELKKKGFSVQVLEGRSCAGGRIRTLTEPFADGMYADAGAMSFLDTQTTVIQYVQEFDLPVDIPPSTGKDQIDIHRWRVNLNKGAEKWPLKLTPKEQALGFFGIQREYLTNPAKALGDPTKPGWPKKDLSALDALTATEFLKKEGASEGAIQLLSLSLLDFYGDGLDSCSALFVLVCQSVIDGYTSVYCVRGGQEALPRRIADRLKKEIHYGCMVNRIEQDLDGVTVHFDRAGTIHSLHADYLVCAIPFPILRDVAVSPAFSAPKTEVIRELANTSVTRVFVQTARKIWEQQNLSGEAATDLAVMLVFSAYSRQSRRGILESYTSGEQARILGRMSESERYRFVVREFGKVFPGVESTVEGAVHKCWDDDPFAKGAYAWYKPGQFLKFLPQLATPEGRVFFAGDQTTVMPGWMEGALQSGIRTAAQVQKAAAGPSRAAGAS